MSAPARLTRLADGVDFVLDAPDSVIGRAPDNEIPIDAAAVSRRHAAIRRTAHGYLLADLDSRNGTFVNGERLDGQPQPLRDGDEIVIAGVETLRFVDPLATPMAPAIGRLTGVWIDPDSRAVWVDAQPLEPPLSERQQILLELLAEHEDSLVDRQTIIETVWADVPGVKTLEEPPGAWVAIAPEALFASRYWPPPAAATSASHSLEKLKPMVCVVTRCVCCRGEMSPFCIRLASSFTHISALLTSLPQASMPVMPLIRLSECGSLAIPSVSMMTPAILSRGSSVSARFSASIIRLPRSPSASPISTTRNSVSGRRAIPSATASSAASSCAGRSAMR